MNREIERQRKLFNLKNVVEFQREVFILRFSRIFGFYGRVSWVQYNPFSGYKNKNKNFAKKRGKNVSRGQVKLHFETNVGFGQDLLK